MEDLDEPCAHHDLDGLPREGRPHPITETPEADRAALVDPAVHAGWSFTQRNLLDDFWHLGVGGSGWGQCEALGGRAITQ